METSERDLIGETSERRRDDGIGVKQTCRAVSLCCMCTNVCIVYTHVCWILDSTCLSPGSFQHGQTALPFGTLLLAQLLDGQGLDAGLKYVAPGKNNAISISITLSLAFSLYVYIS